VVFLALVLLGETVLTPLQILFVNLLTDGLPALALGVEPAHRAIMFHRPRAWGRSILTARSLTPILGLGGLVAAASLAAYALGSAWDGEPAAHSFAFAALVGSQLSASVVFRSETLPFHRLAANRWLLASLGVSVLALAVVFYVPALAVAFDAQSLSATQWLCVAVLSLAPLVVGEAVKASGVLRRFHLTPAESEV
jgi:Ca2+-transporting ATPase